MEYKKKKLLEFDETLLNTSKKDDDSGYEIDDSGMIPKLEELKAQRTEFRSVDEFVEHEYYEEDEFEGFIDDGIEVDYSNEGYIEEKSIEDDRDSISDLFDGYEEIEDDEPDEYEKMFNFEALDHLDRDISDIKIDFYDEENKSEFDLINEKLDRIANSLERIAIALEKGYK